MTDTNQAESLLSLFTTRDSAAAIVGDLTEERQLHGPFWFWFHVFDTVLGFLRDIVREAPFKMLRLASVCCALLAGPLFVGFAAVALFPFWLGSISSWIVLSLLWWGGAVWVGASLIDLAPTRGLTACVLVAVIGDVLLIAGLVMLPELRDPLVLPFSMIGMTVALPLVVSGSIARRRHHLTEIANG